MAGLIESVAGLAAHPLARVTAWLRTSANLVWSENGGGRIWKLRPPTRGGG